MPRYKYKRAQEQFEKSSKWTYPLPYKIGGMARFAWELGYFSKPHRFQKGSAAYILYYSGKEAAKHKKS